MQKDDARLRELMNLRLPCGTATLWFQVGVVRERPLPTALRHQATVSPVRLLAGRKAGKREVSTLKEQYVSFLHWWFRKMTCLFKKKDAPFYDPQNQAHLRKYLMTLRMTEILRPTSWLRNTMLIWHNKAWADYLLTGRRSKDTETDQPNS